MCVELLCSELIACDVIGLAWIGSAWIGLSSLRDMLIGVSWFVWCACVCLVGLGWCVSDVMAFD